MKPGAVSPYEQPKKFPKCRYVGQTTPAPAIRGMAGFAKFGKVGGKVVPGTDKP